MTNVIMYEDFSKTLLQLFKKQLKYYTEDRHCHLAEPDMDVNHIVYTQLFHILISLFHMLQNKYRIMVNTIVHSRDFGLL